MSDQSAETELPRWAVDIRPGLRRLQYQYDFRALGRNPSRTETKISFPMLSMPGRSIQCPEGGWILGAEPHLNLYGNGRGSISFRPDPYVTDRERDTVPLMSMEIHHVQIQDESYGQRTYKAVLGDRIHLPAPGEELVSLDDERLAKVDEPPTEDWGQRYVFDYLPKEDLSTTLLIRGMRVVIQITTLDEDGHEPPVWQLRNRLQRTRRCPVDG